jgi:uncharacterized protein (UPF0147 family)
MGRGNEASVPPEGLHDNFYRDREKGFYVDRATSERRCLPEARIKIRNWEEAEEAINNLAQAIEGQWDRFLQHFAKHWEEWKVIVSVASDESGKNIRKAHEEILELLKNRDEEHCEKIATLKAEVKEERGLSREFQTQLCTMKRELETLKRRAG